MWELATPPTPTKPLGNAVRTLEGETWLATGSRTVCDERPRNGEFSRKTSRIAPQGYISGKSGSDRSADILTSAPRQRSSGFAQQAITLLHETLTFPLPHQNTDMLTMALEL